MIKKLRIPFLILGLFMLIIFVVPYLIPVPSLDGLAEPESFADVDSQFVDVKGLTVHIKQYGTTGSDVILLHGFGASIYSWREVVYPLGENYRVLAYDRPGFGLTERPLRSDWEAEGKPSPYSTDEQINLLIAIMDQFGIKEAVLIGNSAGGTIAVGTALKYPERVKALVLVDAAIYTGGGTPWLLRPLFQMRQWDQLGLLLARQIQLRGEDFLRSAWHDPQKISPEVLENYRIPLQVKHWDEALWELTRASNPQNYEALLYSISVPVLVVTGDDDQIVPTEESIRLAREIPGSELVIFDRCGHVPQEECPADFLAAVEPFLLKLP